MGPKMTTVWHHVPHAQVLPNGDRDVVTITFGTGEISGVFMKDIVYIV